MIFSATASIATALLLASNAAAVSLSSFTPKIVGLTGSCQSVYTTEIEGCQRNMFGSRPQCSQGCIDGLAKLQQAVYRNCGSDVVPDTSIVGVFKLGQGIMALCKVEVRTIRSSATSTSPTPQPTTEEAESTSTEESSSTTEEPTTSSTPTPSLFTTSTPTSTPQNTRPPIRPTDRPAQTPTSTSSSASASRTANSQKSNDDSGGGSPFDIQVAGTASGLQRWSMLCMALSAVALGAMTL